MFKVVYIDLSGKIKDIKIRERDQVEELRKLRAKGFTIREIIPIKRRKK